MFVRYGVIEEFLPSDLVEWGVFALFWSLIDVTEHILGFLFVFFSTINFFMIVLLNVYEWLNEWDHAKLQQWM